MKYSRGQFVDMWQHVFRVGPCALLETLMDKVTPKLDDRARAVLTRLMDHTREQTEWITSASAELVSEKARVRELGRAMRLAGLRSYTDEKGRIYVAADSGSEDT